MGKLNTAAMEEGVRNSKCVIAVVTGAYTRPQGLAAEGEQPVDNAYFKRTYCVNELRWAVEARVPIQPVILADDKKRVGDLLALAPSDLQGIGDVDFIHLDRSRPRFWEAGIDELLENITDLQPLSPRPLLVEPEPAPEPELQPQSELRKVHSAGKPPTLRREAWFKSFVAQTVKALEESFRLGASRVILVGIKGDIHRGQFTLREWP